MNHRHAVLLLCLLGALTASCDEDADSPLDPNAPPVTDGDWYRPEVATTWQWQLAGTVNTAYDVEVYDVDLFESSATLLDELGQDGREVICYFSAGSSEDWRPDFDDFEDADMGAPLDDWEGERWLDVRSSNVHAIMLRRLDLAKQKGCDGVEPDNMDAYDNASGFDLSAADQLGFNRYLANQAHLRGLSVGLKNDGGQAEELVDYFDFELNEQCHEYGECGDLATFVSAGKPIFNAEYADDQRAAQAQASTLCPEAISESIRTLILPLGLDDAFRVSCDDG